MNDDDLYLLTYTQVDAIFEAIQHLAAAIDVIVSNAMVVPSETQLIEDLKNSD